MKIKKYIVVLLLPLLTVTTLGAQVKPGIEVLRENGFDCLQGKRVGLLTNPSGVDRELRSTIDILKAAPGVTLVRLFGPEHGVRGDAWAGEETQDFKDPATGLQVYSLYGRYREPTSEMLEGLDAVVYDIQDVGTRSYTFISSLGLMMRACAAKGVEVIVLDRPNPLGGNKIEGSYVAGGFHSFVGQYRIPYIYGLTVGELATLINEEGLNRGQKGNLEHVKCKLTVVPMKGWRRNMLFADTGLPWVLPSPNIPTSESAVCYPAAGLCGEMYNYLNIGIGYTLPFGLFAEEWIDAEALKARLDSYCLKGVAWRTIHFKPLSGRLSGKLIHGVQYFFTDYEAAEISLTQFYVMQAVNELYGRNPFKESGERLAMFNKVTGTDFISSKFGATMRVADIEAYWRKDEDEFRRLAEVYHIY
ncbi:MAG: DUF1343 domain-containing protein [Bacteroidales bacterium]|nr:DUF1343 domain-containing protein [Bacteroidales bacterium]